MNSSRMIGDQVRIYDLVYRSLYRLGFSGLAKKFWESRSKKPFSPDSKSIAFLRKIYREDVSFLRQRLNLDLDQWDNFSSKIA